MIFNSITFIVFFLLFFPFYWWINNSLSIRIRNFFIILASYIFYGWWDWRFLSLIFISSLIDYITGAKIYRSDVPRKRRLYLMISIFTNLGILGFFKYFNFFIDSFSILLTHLNIPVHTKTLNIILPVGISFYTFQTLSYAIDIYFRKLKPARDILSFFTFVSFFPQLVAGPIERARNLLNQFEEKKTFNYDNCIIGLRYTLWGMFKKVIIADNFGLLADNLFAKGSPIGGFSTLLGIVFFAIQIYADFSGYSDIAIGIAKMLDINLMQNFRTPYFSTSFGEFWCRWHISLSTWFRDYLYIPLGGNRKGTWRTSLNIFITFFLSGLWHGARVNFLIWGSLHGIALIIEKRIKFKLNKYIAGVIVFLITCLFWIPFRADNLEHMISLFASIFDFSKLSFQFTMTTIAKFSNIRFTVLLLVLIVFIFIEKKLETGDFNDWICRKSKVKKYLIYYALFIAIILLGNYDIKPYFIYFQF